MMFVIIIIIACIRSYAESRVYKYNIFIATTNLYTYHLPYKFYFH